jgi:hypothetical protein
VASPAAATGAGSATAGATDAATGQWWQGQKPQ